MTADIARPPDFDEFHWGADTWPFLVAVRDGDLTAARRMLAADPSLARAEYAYLQPLHFAISGGRTDMVRLLLEAGANPLAEGWGDSKTPSWGADTPLARARDRELTEIIQLLEDAAARPLPDVPSRPEQTPDAWRQLEDEMMLAAHRGDADTVRELSHRNPGIAQAGLYEAVHQGHHEVVLLLLEHGADPVLPWRWACWYTPLMHALRYPAPRYETAQLLLDHGVHPDEVNGLGMTALHILAREGTVGATGWLLDRGARIHVRDRQYDSTPLAWAARAGRSDMVSYLLSRGAMASLPGDEPWSTPMAWARRRNHHHITALLADRS
jgi:ankyrin repeat protein